MMTRKHLVALVAFVSFAAAGTAARADDITIAHESFMSTKSRAEVCAEAEQAAAKGLTQLSEVDLASTQPAHNGAGRSRADVRAEVGEASRRFAMMWYPA
ncbi:MAG: DUF4148 domain-containing protein [Rubrivivax sp.]|nr:DUF4148 domain-containing protein [Rubrivivax sp.]